MNQYSQHGEDFWRMKKKLYRDGEEDKSGNREKLKKVVDKNFQTCMIGALSDFELDFGYIWGVKELVFEVKNEDQEKAKTIAIEKCPAGWSPDLKFNSKNSFFVENDKLYAATIIRKNKENLTKEEKQARETWDETRCSILDRGNNKKRETLKEIDNFIYKKYEYSFKIGDKK